MQLMENKNLNVILIICDELVGLKYLDENLKAELKGIEKFRKKCLYFNNHYCNNTPCSASRSIIYTGKNTNHTEVTDNVQSTTIEWQKSMKTVNEGLKTFGTYFKKYNPKYIGKVHLLQELDPNNYIRYKPRLSTENYLNDYDFISNSKMGDYAFDSRMAYYNDGLVTEQVLPSGTNKSKCDYYDKLNNKCLDGIIPFIKNKLINKEKIVICGNYDNPHDILYSNIATNISDLMAVSGQISGSSDIIQKIKNIQSVSLYNDNYNKFSNLKIFNDKSLTLDNCMNSLTNKEQINICVLIQMMSKYFYYGIDYFNKEQYSQYQVAYYRCIKQVDDELSKLYDFLEENQLFENSIICLTSDHGDYVCDHGLVQKAAPIYNTGSNVPLFLSYPHMPKKYIGNQTDIITSHLNLLPTLLILNGETLEYIKNEGLEKPFIDNNGFLIYDDYHVVFIFLSFTFGPLLMESVKKIPNSEAQIDLINKNLNNYNLLTIQGFSVSSKFIVDNQYYNCGWYFSLLHIYIETIRYYHNINNNELINDIDLNYDPKQKYILFDDSNLNLQFAYIGDYANLFFQMYTDTNVIKNFKNPTINIYNPLVHNYNNYIGENYIYKTYLISNTSLTLNLNVISHKINEYDINKKMYYIVDSINDMNIIYCGFYDDIKFILKYDHSIYKLIANPVIVCDLHVHLKNYITHPIFNDITIYFADDEINNIFNIYSKIINLSKIITKITLDHNYNFWFKFINKSKTKCVIDIIYKIIILYNKFKYLRLPGFEYNINELKKNNYQVQIFNLSNDFDEIYNLVDNSRIDIVNHNLINSCLDKLNQNIKYNKLDFIYVSLPSNIITKDVFKYLQNIIN